MPWTANELENVSDADNIEHSAIQKLSRDLKAKVATLTRDEARYMVDYYYTLQNDRIRAKNRVRAFGEGREPHEVILWLSDNTGYLEKQIQRALTAYAESNPVGRWSMSVPGVAGTISAGLLAHIDIEKAPTAGHIESFAGLNPNKIWLKSEDAKRKYAAVVGDARTLTAELVSRIAFEYKKSPEAMAQSLLGARPAHYDEAVLMLEGYEIGAEFKKYLSMRPFNADLKVLLWKTGESFVKVSNNPKDFYGKIYQQHKLFLTERNDEGYFAEDAARILTEKNFGKTTESFKAYASGRLPPAQIHARAKRKAVKLFLSHWHEVAFRYRFGKQPPQPYALKMNENNEYIPVFNNPFE